MIQSPGLGTKPGRGALRQMTLAVHLETLPVDCLKLMKASDDASGGRGPKTATEAGRVAVQCRHGHHMSGFESRLDCWERMRMVTVSRAGCTAFSLCRRENAKGSGVAEGGNDDMGKRRRQDVSITRSYGEMLQRRGQSRSSRVRGKSSNK
jgi:hypothetical protein